MLELLLAALTTLQLSQPNAGELRLVVTDQAGLPIECAVTLTGDASEVSQTLTTSAAGTLVARHLPAGAYRLEVSRKGFASYIGTVEIDVALPTHVRVTLGLSALVSQVTVSPEGTLIDPHQISAVSRVGLETIQRRPTTAPGRSVGNLVNAEPGWLLEANGILHPRGSEYQVQFVVDGLPMTDNRSPAFAPPIEADAAQALTIYTAGFPAEYGRKLGGVIEVVTSDAARKGLHGSGAVSGGSDATVAATGSVQYGRDRTTLSINGGGSTTDRYLDPPVEENYTNSATTAGADVRVEHDLGDRDRIGAIARYGSARFDVPNERVQQNAGQRQRRSTDDAGVDLSYQHIFSDHVLGEGHAFVRTLSADLTSNLRATPMVVSQDRGFTETYVKATVSAHFGAHNLKAGIDADASPIRERLEYAITNPDAFDPGTLERFAFSDRRTGSEQSAFFQDQMRLGRWTVSAGLRWDHYRLLVDRNSVSPRLGVSWSPSAGLVLHASYDRAFQTPAIENLLLASSPDVDSLGDDVVRLPVEPSTGNFYEVGFAKQLPARLRLSASHYRRDMTNFADDDVLLNTGVSFPIAFRRAQVEGTEVALDLPRWRSWWGSASYSNMTGVGYLPLTGGLLLGDEVAGESETSRFPISQDQRNTVRARAGYDVTPRLWLAFSASYGSGLPVEFDADPADALAQYGARIVSRVNFEKGRVESSVSLDASAGLTIYKRDDRSVRLQLDVINLTNRLNVINFAGLFSGTALAPPRSYAVRVRAAF